MRQLSSVRNASLALALGLIVAGLLGEVTVRIAGHAFNRLQVVTSHPTIGWTGRPNLRLARKTYGGGTFRLSTDSLGRRITPSPSPSDRANRPVLLLVGDSFVQGIGVEDEETVGWRLAVALRDRRVINLGVAGYGSCQQLLAVEDFMDRQPTVVSDIIVVAYENDLRDVQSSFDYALARSKPAFHLSGRTLERGAYRLPFLDRLMDASRLVWLARSKIKYSVRPPEAPHDRGLELTVACVREIERLGHAHNARVYVFAHRQLGPPHGHTSEVSDPVWSEFVQQTGARDITAAIRAGPGATPIGFDGLHWSAEGARRATEAILRSLASGG